MEGRRRRQLLLQLCPQGRHSQWNDQIKDEIGELVKKEGVNTVKIFMAGPEKDSAILTPAEMLEAMEHCKDLGAVVEVHAESGEIIKENEKRLVARGITGPEGHLMARPEEVEEEAVTRACAFAKQVNVPLIISGPSSRGAVEIISKARKGGQVVFGNAFAPAIAVDGNNLYDKSWTRAAGFVSNPPLRDDPSAPNALLDHLSNNSGLQLVSSDNR